MAVYAGKGQYSGAQDRGQTADDMEYRIIRHSAWSGLSLSRQFALAGGVVMLGAMLVVGAWVSSRIEQVVVRNTAHATALYMESFIAPLTQNLGKADNLDEQSRLAIDRLLAETTLGQRVVSFKLWRPGGLLVDASNTSLVGQRFEVTENMRRAWEGEVTADFEDLGDTEDVAEAALGLPLLEIYSPIREGGTDRVIAVAEFYEVATQLRSDLFRARAASWAAVACVMLVIGGSLFAIVHRGSRTIDSQLEVLKDLSSRNIALRLRVQEAAARFTEVNDHALRRVGADLHDGPAQLMGFAALRLDALKPQLASDAARNDLDAVSKAVSEALREIRAIARGVALPDIERKSLTDLVQMAAAAHEARTGTPVVATCDVADDPAPPVAVRTCVFRFVQEGLNNAWRHAGGLGQEVRLTARRGTITLSVLDRGPGFGAGPSAHDGDEGMGLAGLTDRVEALGGRLDCLPRDGGGAELRMVLNLGGTE